MKKSILMITIFAVLVAAVPSCKNGDNGGEDTIYIHEHEELFSLGSPIVHSKGEYGEAIIYTQKMTY